MMAIVMYSVFSLHAFSVHFFDNDKHPCFSCRIGGPCRGLPVGTELWSWPDFDRSVLKSINFLQMIQSLQTNFHSWPQGFGVKICLS